MKQAKPIKNGKPRVFWVVSSVDARKGGARTRPWAYWENLEAAKDYVFNGWSDAEFFYESGYYTHVVIEAHMLNHPLSTYMKKHDQYWFKLFKTKSGKVKIMNCPRPKRFHNVIGFH